MRNPIYLRQLKRNLDHWIKAGLVDPDCADNILEDCPEEELNRDYDSQTLPFTTVNVSCGIDSYFVPEGSGKKIEAAIRELLEIERVAIEVTVDDEGTAAIKSLYLDDEFFYEETLL